MAKTGIDVIIPYHSKKDEAGQVASSIRDIGREAAVFQLDVENINSFDGFLQSVPQGI